MNSTGTLASQLDAVGTSRQFCIRSEPHIKPGECSLCHYCPKCRNDECMIGLQVIEVERSHGAPRGSAGAALRALRDQYEQDTNKDSLAQTKSPREAAPKIFEDAISDHEEDTSQKRLVQDLAVSLGMPKDQVSQRLWQRKRPFDLGSLQRERNRDTMRVFLTNTLSHVSRYLSGGDEDAAQILEGLLLPDPVPSDGLRLGDAFLQGFLLDQVQSRMLFARLIEALPNMKEAEQVLAQCVQRALCNDALFGTFKASVKLPGDKDAYTEFQYRLKARAKWIGSDIRRERGADDIKNLRAGIALQPCAYKTRVSVLSLQKALAFIERHAIGRKAGYSRACDIGECTLQKIPILSLAISAMDMWQLYIEAADPEGRIDGSPRLGRPSFMTLYKSVAELSTEKHSLSYYYTGAVSHLAELSMMLNRLEAIFDEHRRSEADPSLDEVAELSFSISQLKDILEHLQKDVLKYLLRTHVCTGEECDGDLLHCGRRAVGSSCKKSEAEHSTTCKDCWNFAQVANSVKMLMNAVANTLGRQHGDKDIYARDKKGGPVHECLTMALPISWCGKSLDLYHRHVVRGVIMCAEIRQLAIDLPVGSLLVNMDHKQKIEPVNFMESSEEYYGKKGISLLGFMVRWRTEPGGPLHVRYIDIVSSNSKQDAPQVQTLLNIAISESHKVVPTATAVILVSDNGPAFTSAENIDFCLQQNQVGWGCGVKVTRWAFFEAQTGKTALDTHFAYVGILIRRFARMVKPVKTHTDVAEALMHGGGIAATTTLRADFSVDDDETSATEESATGKSKKSADSKVMGIRKVHDIHFQENKALLYNYPGVRAETSEKKVSGKRIEVLKAEVALRFENTVDRTISTVAASPAATVPSLSSSAFATSLDIQISETVVEFALKPQEFQEQVKLPALALPVDAGASSASSASVGRASKKLKATLENTRTPFGVGWAEASQRETPQMPEHLKKEVAVMVSDGFNYRNATRLTKSKQFHQGRKTGSLISASMAAQRLREHDSVKNDWTVRFTCSEALVKKEYNELVRMDKQQLQKNAKSELAKAKASSSSQTSSSSTVQSPAGAATIAPSGTVSTMIPPEPLDHVIEVVEEEEEAEVGTLTTPGMLAIEGIETEAIDLRSDDDLMQQ